MHHNWKIRYTHSDPGTYEIFGENSQKIAQVDNLSSYEETNSAAHLICAAPQLYEALKQLLISTEEALIRDGVGCECEQCNAAKGLAYRAIGFAEGKTVLKEGSDILK